MATAKNPILPGFYPDPSICAVGDDFYLVNSSFAYFPGLPVWHSRDLAHWEQIGNVMDRASQLPLQGCGHSQGLFAPTIRYHDGVFYVICTNEAGKGSFIVTADDPAGPWSEPYYLPEASGIDPSLFFDDDNRCYYIGTHPNPRGCRYDGDCFIWIQELDLKTMRLVGEAKDVWNGAMRRVVWPEGSHLYKKDGYYYILHAEGGTEFYHAVAVCRSRSLWGPYEGYRGNPILTHRHLGRAYPVQCAGHGDLVETKTGDWYMVLLAMRPLEGHTMLGRETFLARVVWEDGWPVVNPGAACLTETVETGLPAWGAAFPEKEVYRFGEMERLGDAFLFLRNPNPDDYSLCAGEGLRLSCGGCALTKKDSPVYAGLRQRHHHFRAAAAFCLPAGGQGETGIALLQSNESYLRLALAADEAAQALLARVILCEQGTERVLSEKKLSLPQEQLPVEIGMCLEVHGLKASFRLSSSLEERELIKDVDIRTLSTETAGGFVGCTVGLYAAGGSRSGPEILVKYLTYEALHNK